MNRAVFSSSLLALASLACGDIRVEPTDPTEPRPVAPEPPSEPKPDPRPTDPDPPAPSSFCKYTRFAGSDADAVATITTADGVDLLMRDGKRVPLQLSAPPPPADAQSTSVSTLNGAGMVVVTSSWLRNASTEGSSHVSWFSSSGEELGSVDDGKVLEPTLVATDGTTVLYHQAFEFSQSRYLVRHMDGSIDEIDGFTPSSSLTGGWLTGYEEGASHAFYRVDSGQILPLTTLGFARSVWGFGAGYGYLSEGKAAPWFVEHAPESTTVTVLDELSRFAPETLWVRDLKQSGFGLVVAGDPGELLRFAFGSGELNVADATPPDGLTRIDDACGLTTPMLSDDGRVMTLLGDASTARLGVYDPASEAWQLVGLPVGGPGTFELSERAGTYFLRGGDGSESFCPLLPFVEPPPEDAVQIDELQIVRPADAASFRIDGVETWTVSATPDGTCAAYRTADGWKILDVVGGETLEIDGPDVWFSWVEGS